MTRRILQLAAMPWPSSQGSQVYVGGMAAAQAAAGHQVLLATYGHGASEERALPGVDRVKVAVPPWGSVASGPHPSKVLHDMALLRALARVLPSVDVIHAHHVEAPILAAIARFGRRVPIVYNLHTSLEEELPTYMPRQIGPWAGALGALGDRWVPAVADGCVAPSARGEAVLRAAGARHVARVLPGVNVRELDGGDASRARQRWALGVGPWVVYTGNTDAYQDLDVLYQAMSVVNAGLLVVTHGDTAPAERAAREAGVRSLRVVRTSSFEDVRDALAVASVCALPRRVCAGFPIKLLNQLAAGRVTVACSGSAQPLEGVVSVPDGDVAAFAGALRSVLDDPAMAERLGQAGRCGVAARCTWSEAVRALDGLYDTLGVPA